MPVPDDMTPRAARGSRSRPCSNNRQRALSHPTSRQRHDLSAGTLVVPTRFGDTSTPAPHRVRRPVMRLAASSGPDDPASGTGVPIAAR